MSYKIIGENQKIMNTQFSPNKDDSGIQPVSEVSETAETIKELNSDELQDDKFSPIDLKTRLHPVEISSIIAVDSLAVMEFLPRQATTITRSKKRLAVSLLGKGRQEIVDISRGMKDEQEGKSALDRIGSWFKKSG